MRGLANRMFYASVRSKSKPRRNNDYRAQPRNVNSFWDQYSILYLSKSVLTCLPTDHQNHREETSCMCANYQRGLTETEVKVKELGRTDFINHIPVLKTVRVITKKLLLWQVVQLNNISLCSSCSNSIHI